MTDCDIALFRCRSDNFGLLVHDKTSGATAAIDTPDADAILSELNERNWSLTHILVTHHHYDHVDGNLRLKEATGCRIVGAQADAQRIPGLDETVKEGDTIAVGNLKFHVLETPGHTLGHVTYWSPEAALLFTGDTLFSLGCGRLFEGTAEMMWGSLDRLRQLPAETQIYCGHEYTLANGEFALEIEPDNPDLQARVAEVRERMRAGQPSLPVTLGQERATNPFLRPDSPAIQARLDMIGQPLAAIFAEIRRRKDAF